MQVALGQGVLHDVVAEQQDMRRSFRTWCVPPWRRMTPCAGRRIMWRCQEPVCWPPSA